MKLGHITIPFGKNSVSLYLLIPLVLSAFTHLWNPVGFPDIFYDEGVYMRRTMNFLDGWNLQEKETYYDHPYFGQIFLGGVLAALGYPNSVLATEGQEPGPVETLYSVPRILMGVLAVVDTFLVYKISERRYGRTVAVIASVLFAVMPMTWILRRILLDSILLPFLLSSVLFALYSQDAKETRRRHILVLVSGLLLGLAIFTKIPAFTMIPLIGFLIYRGGSNSRFKTLGLWLIPVLLIPLLWLLQSVMTDNFDNWLNGLAFQTSRENRGIGLLFERFYEIDPVLLIIGLAGLIYAGIRRDMLVLLWSLPFLGFLLFIGYNIYFYWIPVLPAVCIAGARLISEIPNMILSKHRIQRFLPFAAVAGIGAFGVVSTAMLVTSDMSSQQFLAAQFVLQYLNENDDNGLADDVSGLITDVAYDDNQNNNGNHANMTVVASPVYSWIFDSVYRHDQVFSGYRDVLFYPIETNRVILVSDTRYKEDLKANPALALLQNTTSNIAKFEDKVAYDREAYPYTSLKRTFEGAKIEIRTTPDGWTPAGFAEALNSKNVVQRGGNAKNVTQIYPTAPGGREWFMDASDLSSDGIFTTNPSKLKENQDGSIRISGNVIRMHVGTPVGESDWKNIEITGYVRVVSYSDIGDELVWYARGKGDASANENICESTSYRGFMEYGGQAVFFKKELWKGTGDEGYSPRGGEAKKVTSDLTNGWTGFKVIIYNTNSDNSVKMEAWIDDSDHANDSFPNAVANRISKVFGIQPEDGQTSKWRKVAEFTDDGRWAVNNEPPQQCINPTTGKPLVSQDMITWGGEQVTFRAKDATLDFRDLSVREILPPIGE